MKDFLRTKRMRKLIKASMIYYDREARREGVRHLRHRKCADPLECCNEKICSRGELPKV